MEMSNSLIELSDGFIAIKTQDGWKVLNESGLPLSTLKFDWIRPLPTQFFLFGKEGYSGVADLNGNILVRPAYDEIVWKSGGSYFLTRSCGDYGRISRNGNQVIPPLYNSVVQKANGYVQVRYGEANTAGLFDSSGVEIIPPVWTSIEQLNQTVFLVTNEIGKFLYYTKLGTVDYSKNLDAILVSGSQIIASTDSFSGVLNDCGKWIIPPVNRRVWGENQCFVTQNEYGYNVFDTIGSPLNAVPFADLRSLEVSAWLVKLGESDWGLLQSDGKIAERGFETIGSFGNRVKGRRDGKLVSILLRKSGEIEELNSWSNVVELNVSSFTGISRDEPVIKNPTAGGRWFFDGPSRKWGLRDVSGKVIIKPAYNDISHNLPYGLTKVYICEPVYKTNFGSVDIQIGAKAGLVDPATGKVVVEPVYMDVVLTGPADQPLIFGVTNRMTFKRLDAQQQVQNRLYTWVDVGTEKMTRVLWRGSLTL